MKWKTMFHGSMIEKLKKQDSDVYPYIDEDGISYSSKKAYLKSGILNFCSCGNSDDILIYIRDFLEKLDKKDWGTYEDIHYMFLCYWADSQNLTEHGSTIRCSWLENKGKELLKDINWCLENESEI